MTSKTLWDVAAAQRPVPTIALLLAGIPALRAVHQGVLVPAILLAREIVIQGVLGVKVPATALVGEGVMVVAKAAVVAVAMATAMVVEAAEAAEEDAAMVVDLPARGMDVGRVVKE